MSKPNVHGLPPHLRKDKWGYFLDYFVQEGGLRKRNRVRLGEIPLEKAKRILAQHMQAIVDNKFLAVEMPKITFNEAAQGFLAYSRSRKKTFKRDGQIIANLGKFFDNRPLESLSLDLIEEYVMLRKKQRPTLKGSSLNREVACLKAIINRAIRNGQLEKNPISFFKFFKETPRNRTLTPEEFKRLLEKCPKRTKLFVLLAYVTAMRKGEIIGLRWDQVDFQNKIIVLEAADTKTLEKREVPLDEALLSMLRQVPKTLGSQFVFTFKGKRIGEIKTAFNTACRRAGIKDFHFHDLRHCAITNMRKAGVPDNVIMSISGHKTTAMFRRYDAVDRTDRRKALERLRLNDKSLDSNDNLMTTVSRKTLEGHGT